VRIAAQKNKRSGETPPTSLRNMNFRKTPNTICIKRNFTQAFFVVNYQKKTEGRL
jgi:hypothetical protein